MKATGEPISPVAKRGFLTSHAEGGQNGLTTEWYTPPHIFRRLGLNFDVDVAAPKGGVGWIPASDWYDKERDGLAQSWIGRVWMNPPYGKQIHAWMRRFVEHGDGIALTFARTDTAWFHETAPNADAICLLAGRLTFVAGDGSPVTANAGAPSMLLACGDECVTALERSRLGLTFAIKSSAPLQGQLLYAALHPDQAENDV